VIRQASAEDLTFPRVKRRSIARSLAFRSQPLLRRALGTDRTLRLLLGVERTSWRLAFEAAGMKYGEAFYNESPPLTPDVLRAWVPEGSRVLDLGCGIGRLGRLLAQRVDSYVGIDLNEASIRIAQSLAHPPHVRFAIGDARSLRPSNSTSSSSFTSLSTSMVLRDCYGPSHASRRR